MNAIAQKFLHNPVFALAAVEAAAGIIAVDVHTPTAALISGAVIAGCEALKRALVTPNARVKARKQ